MKKLVQASILATALTFLLPAGYAGQKTDRENGPTADNQKNNETDRKMTADIRKAVVDDSSLSTNAHNVKIITRNGEVTLRGRVKSEDEKQAIVSKAEQIAGKGKVTNDLQVYRGKGKEASSNN